jgi:HlyD family type I secretion membrane fusion protein
MTEQLTKPIPSMLFDEAKPVLGTPFIIGVIIIILFFGGFIGWSAFAPIESAAVAQGEVSVEIKRKTIQHFEGGIIGELLIKDGDTVTAGQVLVRLDDTQSKANLALLQGRYDAIQAQEGRLRSERDGLEVIQFSSSLLARKDDAGIAEILDSQRRIFNARRGALVERRAIMEQNIEQYRAEIIGVQGEVKSQRDLIKLSNEEIKGNEDLYQKGMVGKQRMFELKREAADVMGSLSRNQAVIARAEQQITSARLEIGELDTIRLSEVVDELQSVKAELFDYREKINSAQYVLQRTEIAAPIAGIIVGMNVQTIGGVVAPGEALLDIVPTNERLIIEARINPNDIDVVETGLLSHVRFNAFSQRNAKPVEGRVITVSADSLTNERTGEVYYSASIALTGDLKEALGAEGIYPGMQVDVMIVTGSQSTLDYFLRPITQSLNHAFLEQ